MFVEVPDERAAILVGEHALVADLLHEIDVVEDMFERRVLVAERGDGLVEHPRVGFGAVVELVDQVRPAGNVGDKEVVVVIRVVAVIPRGFVVKETLGDLLLDDFVARGQKHIRATFQEEHPEDEILVFRRVHAGAQNIRRRVEVAFKFGEGEFGHGSIRAKPRGPPLGGEPAPSRQRQRGVVVPAQLEERAEGQMDFRRHSHVVIRER